MRRAERDQLEAIALSLARSNEELELLNEAINLLDSADSHVALVMLTRLLKRWRSDVGEPE